jgi:predicted porin
MKKHLIAAAVAGALAVPAMAQVTVYGIIEMGYEQNDPGAGSSTSSIESNEFNSSRFGLRGEEDLGGGMKAFFRLESGLDATNGTDGSVMFDRGAEVGISGGFGSVAFGKLDHAGIEGNELSLIYNVGLGDGSVETGEASDVNDTVRYVTPSMGGVTLNVTHTPKDNGGASHEGITSYQLAGSLAGMKFKLGGGEVKHAADKEKVMGVAASYDFGMAAASVLYQKQDNPAGSNDAENTIVNVSFPIGSGMKVMGQYETLDVDGGDASDSTTTAIALEKALSKRTSVYGLYRVIDPKASGSDNQSTLGAYIKHSF